MKRTIALMFAASAVLLAGCSTPSHAARLAGEVSIDLGNGVNMAFVRVPAGSFMMGSSTSSRPDERPVHKVTFAKPFYMSRYPVTQAQWTQVIGDDRSYFKGPDMPVNNISWNTAQDLVAKLNSTRPCLKFSLPTEAQYEYACRAGSTNEYYYGDDVEVLPDYGWYKVNSGGHIQPVGQKKPNAWGLYDMHGNIFVWCQDVYQKTYEGAPVDGSARAEGMEDMRVIRGGDWRYDASYLRAARRSCLKPDHLISCGMRLVMRVGCE